MRFKILFVCWADYSHSQSWIDLVKSSDFDIRVFASPIVPHYLFPPLLWRYPTYSIFKQEKKRQISEVYGLFPSYRLLRPFLYPFAYKSRIPGIWLGQVIQNWKPDLIHSLSFDMGAYLTWEAFNHLPRNTRPKWVISSWGTEINLKMQDPNMRIKLSKCIQQCDGFIADCNRDISNAIALGLTKTKLPGEKPIPGSGGIDLDEYKEYIKNLKQRRFILIPKAIEGDIHKTLPILNALYLCVDLIKDYHIYLLNTSHEVSSAVMKLPSRIREHCICMPRIPQSDLMKMYGSARMMIAPSLSDGTPNVMLEAMSLGALPIMSPISSIKEWINDGENGLLVNATVTNQIADALKRALTDDDLCIRAAKLNRNIIAERANRKIIRSDVDKFYKRIIQT